MAATRAPGDGDGQRRVLRLDGRAGRAPIDFALAPDAPARAAMARDLGILGIRKLRLEGRIEPIGARDWRLGARLGGTAVQACVVTLEPVTVRVDEDLERIYAADAPAPAPGESEMPEDDRLEPLPASLDLLALAAEALALALPDFPRAPGAELGEARAAPPGAAPLTDERAKPFAGLAVLKGGRAEEGD